MAGHDINYAALSGALHVSGPAERPIPPANVLADFGGGAMYLLVGVLAALTARERTGRGQVVDAAMVDGAASLITMIYAMHGRGLWQDERGVNLLDGGAPYYDTYECSDGRFVAVGAIEPAFYKALLEGLGLSDLPGRQNDRGSWPAHRAAFAAEFRSRTRDEWAAVFEGTDACVAPVLSLAEAPEHPHMSARGIFASVEGAVQPVVAPRFSETPGRAPTPEHRAGADTEAVLAAWGWSTEEIRGLIRAAVIQQDGDA
jgi:alpha-methylacyl-CoA racemase